MFSLVFYNNCQSGCFHTYLRSPSHSCGVNTSILLIAFLGVLQKVFCPYLMMYPYPHTPYLKEKLRLIAKQVLVLDEKLRSENLLRLSPEEALSVCAGVIPYVNKFFVCIQFEVFEFFYFCVNFGCCLRLQQIKNAKLSPSRKKLLLPNETVQTTVYLSITSNSFGLNPFQIISDFQTCY